MRERHNSHSFDDATHPVLKRWKYVGIFVVFSLTITTLFVMQYTNNVNVREAIVQSPGPKAASSSSKAIFINRATKRKLPVTVPSAGPSGRPVTVIPRPPADKSSAAFNMSTEDQHVDIVRKIRVLCIILTMEKDLATKVAAVNATWATRCDKYFYVLNTKRRHPNFIRTNLVETRQNIISKIKMAFETVYDSFLDEFDFLLKADDDTYVVMDNLKFLLSHYKADEPGYIGFHFNHFIKNGYMSGGAGYVISNRALRQLIERGVRAGACSVLPQKDDKENSEDLEIGRCLETVGVEPLSSLDLEGRETFHAYPLEKYLAHSLPGYLFEWAKHPIKTGTSCCSKYTISFHYIPPHAMYYMDFLLYHMSVFGQSAIPQHPVFKLGKD